jgi:filamentous hemagglutinin family protein
MASTPLRPQEQKSALFGTASSVRLLIRSLIITLGLCSGFTIPASADITQGGDGTIVSPAPGAQSNTINITEGTPSGKNLFHSFGTFNLSKDQTANFVQPNPEIQNILGRVNGGQPSSIDGKIQVNGGTSPNVVNLYLMNPAGIVFGKNASLDINGAFTATTAKAIDFGNGNWFNALGANTYTELKGNPIGLAFPGSTPGSIFSAATFDATNGDPTKQTTKPGQSITLVGGTVISTGDIKTAGGNISIATVEGGKYVEIKAEGNILGMTLPISPNNINAEAKSFTALSLPDLLTGRIDSTATGVTIEGVVVKLVGDETAIANARAAGDTVSQPNRLISSGDIIARNLDTSNLVNGGNIQIESSNAIVVGNITTVGNATQKQLKNTGGIVALQAETDIKTERINSSTRPDGQEFSNPFATQAGNVTLVTKTGDIIVDGIDTTGGSFTGSDKPRGGDLKVDAHRLFRVIKGGIDTIPFGKISIVHGGTSFVIGATITKNDPPVRDNDGGSLLYKIEATPGFQFPTDASGSRGIIVSSRKQNGNILVSYTNQSFTNQSFNDGLGLTVTAVTRPTTLTDPNKTDPNKTDPNKTDPNKTDPKNSPDEQAAKQKSKQDCTPSSTSVAANSTIDPNRSEGNASAPSADPCQLVTGTAGGTLQILNNRE